MSITASVDHGVLTIGCTAATLIPSPYLANPGIVTGNCPAIAISTNGPFSAETSEGGTVLYVVM